MFQGAWQAVLVNAFSVLGQPSGTLQPPRLLAMIKKLVHSKTTKAVVTKTTRFTTKNMKREKYVENGGWRCFEQDVNMGFAWGIAEISTGARTFEQTIHLSHTFMPNAVKFVVTSA